MIFHYLPCPNRYEGTRPQRAALRSASSTLIGRFVAALSIRRPSKANPRLVEIDGDSEMQVYMLKQLTWQYVILNDRRKTQQSRQRKVISHLFKIHMEAAGDPEMEL